MLLEVSFTLRLQELIKNAIKDQIGSNSSTPSTYCKPYTHRIEALAMPLGYQASYFQQFDGKGNPRQHVAHFVETCNNAGTDGDLMVKQFVHSLKGNAFDWYVDLEAGSIDSWEQLERKFLNRFYSTRRVVSMIKLTNTCKWEGEPVVEYIQRWRNLSLNCKYRLSEATSIDMCIQGMPLELKYILQGIKPRSFDDLATRAHDMELSLYGVSLGVPEAAKGVRKFFTKAGGKPTFKENKKQAMTTEVGSSQIPKYKKQSKPVRSGAAIPPPQLERKRLTLDERQSKQYPFPDEDVVEILDFLIEEKMIELPEYKRPQEANQTTDPNYFKYHRILGHPLEKCFVLKEKIMKLVQEDKIKLDLGHETSNLIDIARGCEEALEEGWTVVTRKRNNRKTAKAPEKASPVLLKVSARPSKRINVRQVPCLMDLDEHASIKRPSLVSIWEFFPKQFRDLATCSKSCHLIDELLVAETEAKGNTEQLPARIPEGDYSTTMMFSEADLFLGHGSHNRPLFVSGYVSGTRVARILIDQGSAVNIMPLTALRGIGLGVDDLSSSRLVIQGFNQGGERAVGKIYLTLIMGDMEAWVTFHFIDSRTTYNMLPGRPWIHENSVVASTLHQCFKFVKNGRVNTIWAYAKPFTEAESNFADAKFYLEKGNNAGEPLADLASTNNTIGAKPSQLHENKTHAEEGSSGKAKDALEHVIPIWCYIPKALRKVGTPPFVRDGTKKRNSLIGR